MLNNKKYDFSQESNLKERLFKEVKKEYEKARQEIAPLADDELDMVTAAGSGFDGGKCPYPKACDECDKYSFRRCTLGYLKGGR